MSQLSFTASSDVDDGIIQCVGDAPTSTGGFESVSDDITVQVQQNCESHLQPLLIFLSCMKVQILPQLK